MRYIGLILVISLVFVAQRETQAQSDTPASIYITCSGDLSLPYIASPVKWDAPMSDYSDIELRGLCITDVMDAIKANLRHEGTTLVVGTESSSRTPTAEIYFGLDIHGTPLVSLQNLTPTQLEDSPLLSAHLSDSIGDYAWSAAARQNDADLATGVLLYSVGRCNTAMPYFDKAEKNAPDSTTTDPYFSENSQFYLTLFQHVRFYRANCALLSDNYEKAQRLYETFSVPDLLYASNRVAGNLAWVYFRLGKSDKALVLLTKLVTLAQNEFGDARRIADFLTVRSQLYALAFRYDEAIADMDAAIALAPDNPALYVERGQRIMLTYEWDRALADYNRALELYPYYADAYYYRGILYASVPEGIDARRLALADFQRYLELTSNAQHAADAERYISELQAQLDALAS